MRLIPSFLVSALITLLALTGQLRGEDFKIEWAGETFVIPLPDGYTEANDSMVARITAKGLPSTNELIGTYLTDDPGSFAMVQGFVPTKALTFSTGDFKQVITSVQQLLANPDAETKQRIKDAIDKAEATVKTESQGGIEIQSSQPVMFDIYDQSPAHVSFLMLMRFDTKMGEFSRSVPMAMAATIIHLKGKMMYVYFYQQFESRQTYDELKTRSRTTIPRILELNETK